MFLVKLAIPQPVNNTYYKINKFNFSNTNESNFNQHSDFEPKQKIKDDSEALNK